MMSIAVSSVITLYNTGALNAGQSSFGQRLSDIVERLSRTAALASAGGPTTITLADVGADEGLLLAGYPSYAAIRLPRIRDANVEDIQVRIVGKQEVSARTVASIRIMANGRRVSERVLSAGVRDFEWILRLPTSAWNGEDINLSFQLLGDLPDDLCHDERSVGAVVHVDAVSAIEFSIEDEISSVRDVVALLPNDIAISIPDAEAGERFAELGVRLGERLTRLGYRVSFVSAQTARTGGVRGRGLIMLDDPEALRSAGFETPNAGDDSLVWRRNGLAFLGLTASEDMSAVGFLTGEVLSVARSSAVGSTEYVDQISRQNRVTFDTLGIDTSVQQVTQTRSWTVDYEAAQYPSGYAPSRVQLDIRLPEGPGDFTNLVHTMLNDQIIGSQHLETGRLNSVAVDLPANMQSLNNTLKITIQRHRELGGCAVTAQRYPVQLVETSHLSYEAGRPVLPGLAGLPAAFAQGVELRLPDELTGEARLAALSFLAEAAAKFVPVGVDYTLVPVSDGDTSTSRTPFIAVNHIPANASARSVIDDGALRLRDSGELRAAEITNVTGLTVLERVASEVPAPTRRNPNRVISVPGLIGFAQPGASRLSGAPIGRTSIAILHNDASALELN
jgi:hypothetical protein